MSEAAAETVSKAEFDKVTEKYHRAEAKLVDLEKRLEGFTKIAGDPAEILGKLEDYELLKRKKAEGSPDDLKAWQEEKEREIAAALEKRYSAKFDEMTKKLTDGEAELNRLRVVNPTMLKAAELFNAKELPLVQMLVERDCGWQDGQVVVKGPDGKPMYSAKNPKEFMGMEEYLQSRAELYPGLAKAQSSPGGREGGDKMNGNGAGKITVAEFKGMTAQERAKLPTHEQRSLSVQALKSM